MERLNAKVSWRVKESMTTRLESLIQLNRSQINRTPFAVCSVRVYNRVYPGRKRTLSTPAANLFSTRM